MADFVTRFRSFDNRQPVATGLMASLRENLHNIAIAQRRFQRLHRAVHARAYAGIADVAMNGVGEVTGWHRAVKR